MLSKEAGKILIPIFQELEMLEGGVGKIDEAEFIEATLRLYQTLPISDRSSLLNLGTNKMKLRIIRVARPGVAKTLVIKCILYVISIIGSLIESKLI